VPQSGDPQRDVFDVPMASPVSPASPTPYWSPRIVNMPDLKSLTGLEAERDNAATLRARSGPFLAMTVSCTMRR
jgi:hypothetical protein